jgi:hypothetical protein
MHATYPVSIVACSFSNLYGGTTRTLGGIGIDSIDAPEEAEAKRFQAIQAQRNAQASNIDFGAESTDEEDDDDIEARVCIRLHRTAALCKVLGVVGIDEILCAVARR